MCVCERMSYKEVIITKEKEDFCSQGKKRGTSKNKNKKGQKYRLTHQPTTQLPTPIRVIQRRRPMVNTRLQNFFPRQIAFIA